jgi:transcriptional regulator with PAS, ATPase and Fis domain
MTPEPLISALPDQISSHRVVQPGGTPLRRRIAALSSLVASLDVAIEDLENSAWPRLQDNFDFYDEVRRYEISLIRKALRLARGSQTAAARLLKLNATTLNSKIKKYRIGAHE